MRYLLNNEDITGKAFKDANGNSYPSNWLALVSAAQRAAIGVIDVEDVPVIPPTAAEITAAANMMHNMPIKALMAEAEHRILCKLCESDAEWAALKAQLK